MEITWYGLSCFRITERKHSTVVTDPYSTKYGLAELKLKAEVVTVSHAARGHNYLSAVSGREHVLDGPGEYEIGGVFVTGIATFHKQTGERNVVFVFDFDGLTVAHLGDMQEVPTQKQIEALEQVNVLLVPVGGGNSLNASQASELVSMLEPDIVVPMHYGLPGLKVKLDEVDRFLKEMGVTEVTETASLKITSSTFAEGTETVLLLPKI
ncbi:MAG: MBL fold metallo-hydrolase [Anaerolineales bacterium]|nr:MBL fold metallo-hydrolase [Anaerolineales bacterium]